MKAIHVKHRLCSRMLALLTPGLLLMLSLSACSDQEMKLHGRMSTIEYQGKTCWIFIDDQGYKYEVITPSPQILREGLRMQIKAYAVERQTLCQLPTVIDIHEYRPDTIKDL